MDYRATIDKFPSHEPLAPREVEEILRQAVEKLMKLEERVKRLENDSGN